MSQVQASYRFYNNENIECASLNNPIITHGVEEIEKECDSYVLNAHDWSHADYKHHESKTERIKKRKKHPKGISYGQWRTIRL